jgi:hypothetical protein
MTTKQYEKDQIATLEFFPPEVFPIPDADGTVSIFISADSPIDASLEDATAVLDTADSALTVLASEGDRSVTIASSTLFKVGQRYILVNELSQTQEVEILGKSATTLLFDQPIKFNCAVTTSSVKGYRLTVQISAAIAGTKRHYLEARWKYNIDSVEHRHSTYFDIVRRPFEINVTEHDIEKQYAGFGEYTGARKGWKKHEAGAIDDIWSFLAGKQIRPELVYDKDILLQVVALKILVKAVPDRQEEWLRRINLKLGEFMNARVWVDTNDDGSAEGSNTGQGQTRSFDDSTSQWFVTNTDGTRSPVVDETLGMPALVMKVL